MKLYCVRSLTPNELRDFRSRFLHTRSLSLSLLQSLSRVVFFRRVELRLLLSSFVSNVCLYKDEISPNPYTAFFKNLTIKIKTSNW